MMTGISARQQPLYLNTTLITTNASAMKRSCNNEAPDDDDAYINTMSIMTALDNHSTSTTRACR
jgi:hypothetical protein